MKFKPKWYRVAKEGKTLDGRTITREQIEQMGSNYNAKEKHGARIWIEHFRSLLPEGLFQPQGDVLETKSEEGSDGKLGLFALVAPLPSLVEMTGKGKKVYSSIEMHPNYADTGEAYLTGLACTDDPASPGTSMFSFNKENPDFENKFFSEYVEQENFNFDEETPEEEKPSLFNRISNIFSKQQTNNDDRFSDHEKSMIAIAEELDELKTNYSTLQKANSALEEKFTASQAELKEFKDQVDGFSTNKHVPKAQGGDGEKKKAVY